jgi:hypothetical protein
LYAFLKKTNNLWQFQKLDKQNVESSVAEWNDKQSMIYPHCAICLPFACHTQQVELSSSSSSSAKLPVNSEVLIPETCFLKKSKKKLQDTERCGKNIDCLLQCKMCKLTVHQSEKFKFYILYDRSIILTRTLYFFVKDCYVGNQDESLIYGGGGADGAGNWLCDKCIWKMTNVRGGRNQQDPACSLCVLNGGALKLADDRHTWAHLTCALGSDGVTFKNAATRSGLNIPSLLLKKERTLNRECTYCNAFTCHQTLSPTGVTIKCKTSSCKNRFHVSCAYLYGKCAFFASSESSEGISFLCHGHADVKTKSSISNRKVNC